MPFISLAPFLSFTHSICAVGMYYLRTKPATQAIQFTLDPAKAGNRSNLRTKGTGESQGEGDKRAGGKGGLSPVAEIFGEACESCSG